MKRNSSLAICFVFCLFTSSQTFAASITVENISKLPIHSVENSNSKPNMTAIIGGKGLKNKKEKSKNYLVKQREIFTTPELNYCFFPNFSKAENAAYLGRESKKRAGGAATLFIIMDLRQLGRKSQTILQSGLLPMQILKSKLD